MKVKFEYGDSFIDAFLPDELTDVFIPGETVLDPPILPNIYEATKEAILHPLGIEPIHKQVKKGSKVTIVFPDRVKGGFQENSHRKTSIPIIVDECIKAGVHIEDILLICSNGLHRKNTADEWERMLGPKIFNEFYPRGQIINHDSEDKEHLVDLGYEEQFHAKVVINKYVYDSDLCVLIGHTLGNPYGGYSGGYKHCATGITNWESIASHHNPEVMHHHDFLPVSTSSTMRQKFDAIGKHMEKMMKKKFFTCDAVLDTYQRQIAVFCGETSKVQQLSWKIADQRTYVKWAKQKYAIMIIGLPTSFHYGKTMGTNAILIKQAISAEIIRHKRVLADNVIIIAACLCDGNFGEEFPSYQETFEKFHLKGNPMPTKEEFINEMYRQEFIDQYRFHYAYHPFHAYSMMSCGQIIKEVNSMVYMVGAMREDIALGLGFINKATIEGALEEAFHIVGKNAKILALPKAFTTASVHLCLTDENSK